MIGDIGVPELLIILAIVMLLFGAGRVGRVGKDLGTSIKEFRKAMSEDEAETKTVATVSAPALPPPSGQPAAPEATTVVQSPPADAQKQPPPLF